jgi:hypothetical protein
MSRSIRRSGGHRLRHLALHVGERGFLDRPAIAAHLVRMVDVHRGAEIAVERLRLREREGIIGTSFAFGKLLRNEGEDRRRLGQGATVGHQRRHPPLRIDRKILRVVCWLFLKSSRSAV